MVAGSSPASGVFFLFLELVHRERVVPNVPDTVPWWTTQNADAIVMIVFCFRALETRSVHFLVYELQYRTTVI